MPVKEFTPADTTTLEVIEGREYRYKQSGDVLRCVYVDPEVKSHPQGTRIAVFEFVQTVVHFQLYPLVIPAPLWGHYLFPMVEQKQHL